MTDPMGVSITKRMAEAVVNVDYNSAVENFARLPSAGHFIILVEAARALQVVINSTDEVLDGELREVGVGYWRAKLGSDWLDGPKGK